MESKTRVKAGRYMSTLAISVGLTLLASGMILLAISPFMGIALIYWAISLFVVAFATAPLFARIFKKHASRAGVFATLLGWALSAPLSALFDVYFNKIDDPYNPQPYELLPLAWLLNLIPLLIVIVVDLVRDPPLFITNLRKK